MPEVSAAGSWIPCTGQASRVKPWRQAAGPGAIELSLLHQGSLRSLPGPAVGEVQEHTTRWRRSADVPGLLELQAVGSQIRGAAHSAAAPAVAGARLPPRLRRRGRAASTPAPTRGERPGRGWGGRLHGFTCLPGSGPASSKTRGPLVQIPGSSQACPSCRPAYGPLLMLDPNRAGHRPKPQSRPHALGAHRGRDAHPSSMQRD